jgi:RNA polymerase sigma factor (sigma-70 family)
MSISPLARITRDVRNVLLRRDGAEATDGQLVRWFTTDGDEAAFEAIVRRHGPMVWGVCHRLLGNLHDTEDAFQATFLVLARKAAAVVPPERVADFLYGVAYRAALKARAARFRRREYQLANVPEPELPDADPGRDLRPVLDRELSRLPEKYRLVVLLCDLEGKTRREAAGQLGWPEGTVAGRLARGRALLGRRLSRCGVTLSAGAVVALLEPDAARACVAVVRTAGAAPARVASLARGVVNAMWLSKVKAAMVVVLGTTLAVGGAAGVARVAAGPGGQGRATAAAPGRASTPSEKDGKDAQRLQGTWVCVSLVIDGKTAAPERVKTTKLFLTNKRYRTERDGKVLFDSTYTIDPGKDPKWMDIMGQEDFAGKLTHGIYRLEGDRLTLCYPRSEKARPTAFESTKGSGRTLVVFRREGK